MVTPLVADVPAASLFVRFRSRQDHTFAETRFAVAARRRTARTRA
jgi:6-phosphogluconate dehydrogenase (decarboxylating)